jgi:monoterpene epsilon-lactone hydrolase
MSILMTATRGLLRLRPNVFVTEDAMRKSAAAVHADAPVPAALAEACDVRTETVEGFPVITLTPRSGASGIELVYIHGGAYIHPLIGAHWQIISTLQRLTGATVTVPRYAPAPKHGVDDAHRLLDAVVATAQARAGRNRVVITGDSAAATKALGQAIRARDSGSPAADALILFSPWVDATMSNPAIRSLAKLDAILAPEGLVAAARWWAGDRGLGDPLLSPINDRLSGLPPQFIYQGGHDVFAADAVVFADKVRAAGGSAVLHQYSTGFHDFVGAGWTREAKTALADAAARIRGESVR